MWQAAVITSKQGRSNHAWEEKVEYGGKMNQTRLEKGQQGEKSSSKIKHVSVDVHCIAATGAQTNLSRINSLVFFVNEAQSLAAQ